MKNYYFSFFLPPPPQKKKKRNKKKMKIAIKNIFTEFWFSNKQIERHVANLAVVKTTPKTL